MKTSRRQVQRLVLGVSLSVVVAAGMSACGSSTANSKPASTTPANTPATTSPPSGGGVSY